MSAIASTLELDELYSQNALTFPSLPSGVD